MVLNTSAFARNIAQVTRTAEKNLHRITIAGVIGDKAHQRGTSDHTRRSTHKGKLGKPTQGVYHAIDLNGSTQMLRDLETFTLRSWRRGEFYHIKYINVLNKHYNLQSAENWEKAKAGKLKPSYSADHHFHLSLENEGAGDFLDQFFAWLDAGRKFPDEIPTSVEKAGVNPTIKLKDDDMGMTLPVGFGADHEGNDVDKSKVVGWSFEPIKTSAMGIQNGSLTLAADGPVKVKVNYWSVGASAWSEPVFWEITDHTTDPFRQMWLPEKTVGVRVVRMPRALEELDSAVTPAFVNIQFGVS